MKYAETLLLEMRILDDGLLQARRKDRKRLTEDDWREIEKWADSSPGITVNDAPRVWPAPILESKKRGGKKMANVIDTVAAQERARLERQNAEVEQEKRDRAAQQAASKAQSAAAAPENNPAHAQQHVDAVAQSGYRRRGR